MYRTNCPPPPEPVEPTPPIPFRNAHPRLYDAGVAMMGAIVLIIAICWAIYGASPFGEWICKNILHIYWIYPGTTQTNEAAIWLTGMVGVLVFPAFYFGSRIIGECIEKKFLNKND